MSKDDINIDLLQSLQSLEEFTNQVVRSAEEMQCHSNEGLEDIREAQQFFRSLRDDQDES